MSGSLKARGVAAVAALGLVGVLFASAPATAAEPDILVSDDGVTFVPQLDDGLFDDLGLLTPLSAISASLWVRNTSDRDASLRLSVDELVSDSPEFRDSLAITASVGAQEWAWTLADPSVCDSVVPSVPVGAGQIVRIDLTASLEDVSGQDLQDESAEISFSVAARDAQVPFPNDPCALPGDDSGGGTDNGSEGGLSGTGADVIPLISASLALLVAGLVILLARRRRREETA
jgi:hypothetical protein